MKPAATQSIQLAPALTPARTSPPTVLDLIDRLVVPGGKMTQEDAAVLATLVKLKNDEEDRNAWKQFTAAFKDMQDELPTIVAQTAILNRGKYERFEDVMEKVGPILRKHGFTVRFSQPVDNDGKPIAEANRVTEICHLSHVGGHSESNSFSVRTGGKSDSETQADCKAATTAKRNALLNALNIVIRQDSLQSEDDARNDGDYITEKEAMDLKVRVTSCGMNEATFLKLGQAATYAEIRRGAYPVLVEMLLLKERRK